MPYTKNSWEPGDIITAAKLDHMEDGIAAGGISESVKTALLQIAAKVAYIDDQGQDYYDALEDALYPTATLTSITAVYTQTGTVYATTSLDSLKTDLVVTAYYDDGSTATVTTYTLSGTLSVGTSTITATYSGLSDTFDVTVSAAPTVSSIAAVYTQSGTVYDTDTLDSLKADLVVTATYSDSSTATVPSADYTLSGTLTVGTSTITVSYENKTTTFNVTVSEKYTYTLSDLHLLNAGTSPGSQISASPKPEGEIILLYTDMSTKRRSFTTPIVAPRCEKKSTVAYPTPSNLTDTTEYPIKVPSDATGVSVSITPNTQYISIYAYSYDDTNHYVCDFVNGKSQTGWALGTGTLSFPAGTYQYISLCSKYNSSGSSYPTDPTELTVTFTTT